MEKAGVDAEVAKVTRLSRAHDDDQYRLRRALEAAERRSEVATRRAKVLRSALARRIDTSGDRFAMVVHGHRFTRRVDAGTSLRGLLLDLQTSLTPGESGTVRAAGYLGGFPLLAQADAAVAPEVEVKLDGAEAGVRLSAEDVRHGDPVGPVTRLERPRRGLEDALAKAREDGSVVQAEADEARCRLGRPFEHAVSLRCFTRRQQEISDILTAEDIQQFRAAGGSEMLDAAPHAPAFLADFDARSRSKSHSASMTPGGR